MPKETIEINPERITYLVELFGLSECAFLERISDKLSKNLTKEQVFTKNIQINFLKRTDKIFRKGLSFYTDPSLIRKDKEASIFFRKDHFNADLNFGDREIVSKTEDAIASLTAIAKLSSATHLTERKFLKYSINKDASEIAHEVREKLHPTAARCNDRDFLKSLIEMFAEQNIMVHEFVEGWNKKNKSSINGFFIAPNHIAIKRNQRAMKREIFTLVHELGHYMLDNEELDEIDFKYQEKPDLIEEWCNKFAFHFLVDDSHTQELNRLADSRRSEADDFYDSEGVRKISEDNHISRLALFTHLASEQKISWFCYKNIKESIQREAKEKEREQKLKREEEKEQGRSQRGSFPQPILLPLKKEIYALAYLEGVVDEYEVLGNCVPKGEKTTLEDIVYG